MKRVGLFLFGSLFCAAALHAATLYPVVVNDRWGFVDKAGKMVINPQFERAGSFSEGLAEVRLGRWGYVDGSGKIVINPQFDRAAGFSDGLAAVDFGGKYGYVDTAGKYVINPQFDDGASFSEGRAVIKEHRR